MHIKLNYLAPLKSSGNSDTLPNTCYMARLILTFDSTCFLGIRHMCSTVHSFGEMKGEKYK